MLELKNIHKQFEDFHLKGIDLHVNKGDYYVVLGKSGAGKTILLESIAGLLPPDEGTVWLKGKDITQTRIQNRKVGLVFQDYAVFPHKTVFQNIAYPLSHLNHQSIRKRVHELAVITGVDHLLHRYPATLSGGEVQRTVLARTLALEPEVLLLDEPLTSLDVQYRRELQALLRQLNRKGQTIVHVTHDYEEALALANRVAVMQQGKIVQEGEVKKVFRNPKNKFIADFVGIRNFFLAEMYSVPGSTHTMAKISDEISFYVSERINGGEKRIITIDANSIILSSEKVDSTALNNFSGKIIDVIPVVQGLEVVVDVGVELAVLITEKSYKRLSLEKNKQVWLSFKASAIIVRDY